jgi:hypothetical protein
MTTLRLRLPDVTLVAVDTICHKLTAMALRECCDKVEFGSVLILSDKSLIGPDSQVVSYHKIAPCTLYRYGAHIWYSVPPLVQTSHYLIAQWDGWVLDPGAWTDDFLRYDYIGAPWGWHHDGYEVGNGGFSLRSTALGEHVAKNPSKYPFYHPEDDALCRRHRVDLERQNFTWAPEELAMRFAFERTVSQAPEPHFGYHGVFNWPRIMPPAKVHERLRLAPPHVLDSPEVQAMLAALPGVPEEAA